MNFNTSLQDPARWFVEQHIIGDDGRHTVSVCQVGKLMQPHLIVRTPPQCHRHIDTVAKGHAEPATSKATKIIRFIWNQNGEQAFVLVDDVFPMQDALRLAAALLAYR